MISPAVIEIDRIARINDPILRNLQITQCYYELSQAAAGLLGFSANWCAFATWASKQAGQTIRQEDLLRALEARFDLSPEISAALEHLKRTLANVGARLPVHLTRSRLLEALHPQAAFARAADAVARGNKKVFEEIGREFARLIETFSEDDHFNSDKVAQFCSGLRPGDPPQGQRLLAEAFTAYCDARFRRGKEKSERMLLANICAGYHEQIRLQPEIAEALNAALGDPAGVKTRLAQLVLPGFYLKARTRVLRDRPTLLDAAFERLIDACNGVIRQIVTDHLMTLCLSDREPLRLGRDLQGEFPEALAEITNPRLRQILAAADPTSDSLLRSGARDWANFTDRIHFIADFFRVYQEQAFLFDPPFTSAQVKLLKSGVRPDGRL